MQNSCACVVFADFLFQTLLLFDTHFLTLCRQMKHVLVCPCCCFPSWVPSTFLFCFTPFLLSFSSASPSFSPTHLTSNGAHPSPTPQDQEAPEEIHRKHPPFFSPSSFITITSKHTLLCRQVILFTKENPKDITTLKEPTFADLFSSLLLHTPTSPLLPSLPLISPSFQVQGGRVGCEKQRA